jgi:hypothetical protein
MSRALLLAALALAWAGCSGGGLPGGANSEGDLGVGGNGGAADFGVPDLGAPADLAVPHDLAAAHDLAAPHDLAVPLDLTWPQYDLTTPRDLTPPGPYDFTIGTNSDGAVACVPPGGQTTTRYVWSGITVPEQRSQFAFDLNGDGRVDNQLGNIIGALDGQMLGSQDEIDQSIASGRSITLMAARSSDPTFTNDVCAETDVLAGVPLASPDAGSGGFTVDGTVTPGDFFGTIAAARFTSEPSPSYAQVPTVVRVPLPIFGAVPTEIVGARITYVRAADGQITGGQVNGAVRNQDVIGKLIPALAATFNQYLAAHPATPKSFQILSIFDNGGKAYPACPAGTCQNFDGSCAVKGDNKIDDCEVSTSGLIQNVLAPDVQLFDAAGNYRPSVDNTHKDSLSIGFAFTAVPASF